MNKVTLPTRTKIAACWLIVIGLLLSITGVIISFQFSDDEDWALLGGILFIIAIVVGVSFIGPGIILLMKTARALLVAIAILTLDLFGVVAWLSLWESSSTVIMPLALFFGYLIPLILVISDIKVTAPPTQNGEDPIKSLK